MVVVVATTRISEQGCWRTRLEGAWAAKLNLAWYVRHWHVAVLLLHDHLGDRKKEPNQWLMLHCLIVIREGIHEEEKTLHGGVERKS
jgi:hypothetical protein